MTLNASSSLLQDSGRKYPSNGVDYPLRFFNMLHFQRPKSMAEIFKWCIILAENSGLIDRITDTMARYPVTPITVKGDIGTDKDYWSDLYNNHLKIREELVANGKDYYTFGNCLVSIVPPFKRYLVCNNCNNYKQHCINDDNADDRPFKWEFKGWKFQGKCLNCKKMTTFKIKDEYLEGEEFAKKITIHRWPITQIKIRDIGVAGKKKIYYAIEEKYKIGILKSDKFTIANVPETFILACKKNPSKPIIELPNDLTFHYKYEHITEAESEGLAKPFFFSAWKDVFMSFILRKAQETIASDHLLPNRFIFPANNGNVNPLQNIDGSQYRQQISTILKRQQNDPNEIGILSFPLGYQALGGQGKALSLVNEIEMQDRRILFQLGIPPELVFGGMTWSGGNVSLRMLENLFLYYVNKHNTFLDFLTRYIARQTGKGLPEEINLLPFRMADDVQQTNILLALGAQGRISEKTAMSMIGNGINIEDESKQMEEEIPARKKMAKARAEISSQEANTAGQETAIGQVKTQAIAGALTNDINQQLSSGQNLLDGVIMQTVQGIINKYNTLNVNDRAKFLTELQASDPVKWQEVIGQLNGITSTKEPVKAPIDITKQ